MRRTGPFILLALLLVGAWALHAAGYLHLVGGVGSLTGWRFGFSLALFFALAVACAALPRRRLAIVLGGSLLHLLVVYDPLKAAIAVAIWIAFYPLAHLRLSWWLKAIPALALFSAPFVLIAVDPTSILNGAVMIAFCASNFPLRSALYAYETATRGEALRQAGLPGYLMCLAAMPLALVSFPPIGFLVLVRGLRREDDPAMRWRGLGEIALGALFLVAFHAGTRAGVLPVYPALVRAAEGLDALTAFAASHLLLLRFFLKVAGDIHIAVGMLRILGFDIPSGMEKPYLSRSLLDFWRRWNTYYRDYLLALGYYPVAAALKRRPVVAAAAGGAAAFLLTGIAHAVQYAMRHPREVTWRIALEAQVWAVVFGAVVIAGMVREVRRRRLPRARPAGAAARAAGVRGWLREAGAIALALSVASVILLLYYAPLMGLPLATGLDILAAFLRPPW